MDECQCARMVISAVPAAQPPLVSYEEDQKLVEQLRDVGEWLRCLPLVQYFVFRVCVVSVSSASYVSIV